MLKNHKSYSFFLLLILFFSLVFHPYAQNKKRRQPAVADFFQDSTEPSETIHSLKRKETSKPFTIQNVNNTSTEYLLLFPSKKAKNSFKKRTSLTILREYTILPLLLIRMPKRASITLEGTQVLTAVPNRHFQLSTPPSFSTSALQSNQPMSINSSTSIGADTLWNHGYKGKDVKIAIIDTGVAHHKEFNDRIVAEKSFVKPKYGYESDLSPTENLHFHGTAVAGVAAGAGKNPKGQGIAPQASILNARVFAGGDNPVATPAGIIAAIEWAVQQESDVINLSLGGGGWYTDPQVLAVNEAVRRGTTVVAAAGNQGNNGKRRMSVGSPGVAKEAITVGAVNEKGKGPIKPYSSLGPTFHLSIKPDLSAPSDVYSTTLQDRYTDQRLEGTSFSSPHVAGAAALFTEYIEEQYQQANIPGTIKSLFMQTATTVTANSNQYGDLATGTGRIDLTNAFNTLTSYSDTPKLLSITPTHLPTGKTKDSPLFPYSKTLFQDEELKFNFTLVSSYSTSVDMSYTGNISNVLPLPSKSHLTITPSTTLWEYHVKVGSSPEGYYQGAVTFSTSDGKSVQVPMQFKLETPKARLLWDMQHTSWIYMVSDFPYGQNRLFFQQLTRLNVAVDLWSYSSPITPSTRLDPQRYDLLYLPDAATYYSSTFPNGTIRERSIPISFTESERLAIQHFVKEGGTALLTALGSTSTTNGETQPLNNFTSLNKLTSYFGIHYSGSFSGQYTKTASITNQTTDHLLTVNVEKLAYKGCNLNLAQKVLPIARTDDGTTMMALNSTESGGNFLAASTNYFLDNNNYRGIYPSGTVKGTKNFVQNLVRMAASWNSSAPPYVQFTEPSQGAITNENVSVSWDGGDTGEGVKLYHTKIDNKPWITNLTSTSYTFNNLKEGNHTIYVKAIDFQGHNSVWSLETVVDKTPPTITFLNPKPNGTIAPQNVNITWKAQDKNGVKEYQLKLDNSSWKMLGTPSFFQSSLEKGQHTLSIKAIDLVGNSYMKTITFTVQEQKEGLFNSRTILVLVGVSIFILLIATIIFWKKFKK